MTIVKTEDLQHLWREELPFVDSLGFRAEQAFSAIVWFRISIDAGVVIDELPLIEKQAYLLLREPWALLVLRPI